MLSSSLKLTLTFTQNSMVEKLGGSSNCMKNPQSDFPLAWRKGLEHECIREKWPDLWLCSLSPCLILLSVCTYLLGGFILFVKVVLFTVQSSSQKENDFKK